LIDSVVIEIRKSQVHFAGSRKDTR